jgi:hypothetical protein
LHQNDLNPSGTDVKTQTSTTGSPKPHQGETPGINYEQFVINGLGNCAEVISTTGITTLK